MRYLDPSANSRKFTSRRPGRRGVAATFLFLRKAVWKFAIACLRCKCATSFCFAKTRYSANLGRDTAMRYLELVQQGRIESSVTTAYHEKLQSAKMGRVLREVAALPQAIRHRTPGSISQKCGEVSAPLFSGRPEGRTRPP